MHPSSSLSSSLHLALLAFRNSLLALLFFGVCLFLPAGTFKFPNAWLFLGIFILCYGGVLVYFAFTNPQYAQTRFDRPESERAQIVAMSLVVLAVLGMFVVAGLDFRFHWSHVPIFVVAVFALLLVLSIFGFYLVMRQNSYASRAVEIQPEQKVIATGLYAWVRHPMYLAASLLFLSAAFVLGSWYAVLPALCIPFFLSIRIRNEEQVLCKGLAGYEEYMRKVRWRLVPGVW